MIAVLVACEREDGGPAWRGTLEREFGPELPEGAVGDGFRVLDDELRVLEEHVPVRWADAEGIDRTVVWGPDGAVRETLVYDPPLNGVVAEESVRSSWDRHGRLVEVRTTQVGPDGESWSLEDTTVWLEGSAETTHRAGGEVRGSTVETFAGDRLTRVEEFVGKRLADTRQFVYASLSGDDHVEYQTDGWRSTSTDRRYGPYGLVAEIVDTTDGAHIERTWVHERGDVVAFAEIGNPNLLGQLDDQEEVLTTWEDHRPLTREVWLGVAGSGMLYERDTWTWERITR